MLQLLGDGRRAARGLDVFRGYETARPTAAAPDPIKGTEHRHVASAEPLVELHVIEAYVLKGSWGGFGSLRCYFRFDEGSRSLLAASQQRDESQHRDQASQELVLELHRRTIAGPNQPCSMALSTTQGQRPDPDVLETARARGYTSTVPRST
jgi:hypothetical protein